VVVERTGLVRGAVEDPAHAVGELHAANLRAGPARDMGGSSRDQPWPGHYGSMCRPRQHGITP